jgi:putative pyruvate formate lyase activating enzyme
MEPSYLETHRSGALAERIEEALGMLGSCTVCPRDCGVNRLADKRKLCRVGRKARVSSHFAHFGEEDVLRGWNGSGTIFFSWCNLKCVFCQNWEVSNEGAGREAGPGELAWMMLDLQDQGCHNINFVTPEHVVPQILEALPIAIGKGLRLPIVYNTSAYDSLHSLRLMEGIVDIYLPDFKYWDPGKSARLLKAKDYPEVARAAVLEMHRQVGDLRTDGQGLATRGLLVRHLAMPGSQEDSGHILRWLAEKISPDTWVNIMDQYHPAGKVLREPRRYPSLASPLQPGEHSGTLKAAEAVGLQRIDRRRMHPKLRALLRKKLLRRKSN